MTRGRRDVSAHRLWLGAGNGLLATLPMSGVMLAAQRAGRMGRLPPGRITDAAVDAAGAEETPRPARRALATAAHLAFGAGAGALYAWWTGRRGRRGGALHGAGFGTLVWLGSYAGWVPALGILPPPHRDRPGRQPAMLVAHWVYGAVLGARLSRVP